jgi:hypothetical protein
VSRRATTLPALVTAGVVAPLATLALAARPAAQDVPALVRTTAAYVASYERAFARLLADETSVQRVETAGAAHARTRTTLGELFLTFLPVERRWVAVHDVADVDGVPVTDREDLESLLAADDVRAVGRRLAERNARYNLGTAFRNFNEPTLVLQLFGPDAWRRIRFSRQAIDRSTPGVTLVTLAFREHDRPTLVQSVRGGPVFSHGSVVVEAATGRIRETTIALDDGPVTADLTTVFAYVSHVDLWVPTRFTERYTVTRDHVREVTRVESRYANYRRFETSGRVEGSREP